MLQIQQLEFTQPICLQETIPEVSDRPDQQSERITDNDLQRKVSSQQLIDKLSNAQSSNLPQQMLDSCTSNQFDQFEQNSSEF